MSTREIAPSRPDTSASGGVTFVNVLRSEWTKFWSVRSTMWTILVALVATIGLSVLLAWGTTANWDQLDASDRATFDATNHSLFGLLFGQIAFAVIGVLAVTSEYSTGGVRTTFVAVPQRGKVLAAKAVIIAATQFVVGLVVCFVSFLLCQLFFATNHVEAHLGDTGVARALVGGGLYIAGVAMFGLAIGAVLRHSAGSITSAVALLLVIPPLTNLIPGSIGDTITRYFTSNAGSTLMEVRRVPDHLSVWAGFGVFTLEWLILLVIGAFLLQRRDA